MVCLLIIYLSRDTTTPQKEFALFRFLNFLSVSDIPSYIMNNPCMWRQYKMKILAMTRLFFIAKLVGLERRVSKRRMLQVNGMKCCRIRMASLNICCLLLPLSSFFSQSFGAGKNQGKYEQGWEEAGMDLFRDSFICDNDGCSSIDDGVASLHNRRRRRKQFCWTRRCSHPPSIPSTARSSSRHTREDTQWWMNYIWNGT